MRRELLAALEDVIVETAQEMGSDGVPSGTVYAALMTYGVDLNTYNVILDDLKRQGRITLSANVIHAV